MKNTTWQRLQPGQIVKFSYKSVDSKRGMNRTVLIIDPRYKYKKNQLTLEHLKNYFLNWVEYQLMKMS